MKKLLKKLIALGVASLSLSPLVNLVPVASAQEQVLNISTSAEPPTIDPALATDSTSGSILRNVFEGLTVVSPEGEVQPGAAESWEVSDDGLVYTFKLREGNKWSNGDPVTAQDFEFAWKRVLNPETASQYASIMFPIKGAEAYNSGEGKVEDVGIKAVDESTLEVTLVAPTAYFLELPAFYSFMPVNQKVVEGDENWAMEAGEAYVTNGAFKLETWNHNSDYVLTKNDQYWDKDNVKLDQVNVKIIESEATANAEFQAGSIDYLGSPYSPVSLDNIDQYRADGILQSVPYAAIYWYKLNTTDEVLSNVNIRKALALAIDRQGLIDNVTKGEQIPALGYIPPTIEGFEEDRGYLKDADFEQAKELLAKGLEELGMKDPSELNIEISINTSEAHSTIAQYIQEGWSKNLGINASIRNSEWQVYLDELSNLQYQVGRLGWIADFNDASTFLDMYRTADTGNNDTGWESEEFKNKLDEANQEQDPEKRKGLLLEAEAMIMEDLPVIPLYYYTNNFVVKDGVEGMQPDALGNINLKNVSIKAE
ncbi:peptide ABC transporter substrate-binding protein [Ignavigranum ruoffiae]|uniref:Oligopeptide transport system substrate-binding protein n=2 Tax=Ignavigranum ruoffiae TaxID=89093 RepID=A0A1H9CTT4_9LACT|nr:peptide ABC transporter substrate-binding protein [Ignavigranum ruoffiae]SEQ03988.1 oligopeptide transport system substrate-binding protein [Ignavigranum ruoffiae]